MPIMPPDGLDTNKLEAEIKAIYSKVATNPDEDFHFHRGPAFAERFLSYDPKDLEDLPIENTASFAGVGNPHLISPIVEGETVVVRSVAVPHPRAVRYAWGAADEPNLKNAAGLPAPSFRTDDWPMVTRDR